MKPHGGLLGKQGAEREKLELVFEWVELLRAHMLEQCVRLRVCPDIEMLAKVRERGCSVLRRAVSGAANVKELLFPATDTPCVKSEAALKNGAGERRAMQIHAPKTANDWIAPLASNPGSAPDAQNVRRHNRQIYARAQLGRIRCSESPGAHRQNFLCQAQHLPQ